MASFELFLARRYLRSKKRTAFISAITYISLLGIALGVAVLVVALSVMNGFEYEVRSRFISNDSHMRIRAYMSRPFKFDKKEFGQLISMPINSVRDSVVKKDYEKPALKSFIAGYSPYIEQFGMLKGDYTEGALVKGVDEASIGDVALIKDQIVAGKFDLSKKEGDYPGIVIGKGLADQLNAIPGEKIRIISSAISTTFSQPPVMVFRIAGWFESGLAEIDGGVCYISLKSAQKLFRMRGKCNGIYLKLNSIDDTDIVKKSLLKQLEFPLLPVSWKDLHKNLYAWMELEKMGMGTILSLIILVAAFNILSSLIMLVMEKKKAIGILMAMGATKKNITNIFIIQGMIIGIIGTILGVIMGLALCYLQLRYEFIALPGDVYFINALPIKIEWLDIAIIPAVSLLITFLATIYPSRQAGKLLPSEIIRND